MIKTTICCRARRTIDFTLAVQLSNTIISLSYYEIDIVRLEIFESQGPSLTGGNVVNVATCSLTRGRTCVGVGYSCGGVPTGGRSFSPIFSVPTTVPVCPSWNHLDPACQPRWRAQKLLNERWRHEPAAWKVCESFLSVSTVFTPFRFSSRVISRSTATPAHFFATVSVCESVMSMRAL